MKAETAAIIFEGLGAFCLAMSPFLGSIKIPVLVLGGLFGLFAILLLGTKWTREHFRLRNDPFGHIRQR